MTTLDPLGLFAAANPNMASFLAQHQAIVSALGIRSTIDVESSTGDGVLVVNYPDCEIPPRPIADLVDNSGVVDVAKVLPSRFGVTLRYAFEDPSLGWFSYDEWRRNKAAERERWIRDWVGRLPAPVRWTVAASQRFRRGSS